MEAVATGKGPQGGASGAGIARSGAARTVPVATPPAKDRGEHDIVDGSRSTGPDCRGCVLLETAASGGSDTGG